MASQSTLFIVKITNYLPLIEKIFLTASFIGIILTLINVDSRLTNVALIGLGITFFLYAYRPIDIPRQENEQFGFWELFGFMIAPKVLWISSAVSTLGILFYLSNSENEGYKSMVMIGGSTIGAAALLLLVFMVSGVNHIKKIVIPILLRAVPLFLVDMYLLFK